MSKSNMKATSLRSLLIVCVLLAVGAVAGGFYYGLEQVKEYAIEVSHTYADANAAERQVSELQKLKTTLANSQTLVKKADQLFATESNYQSRAVQDVQRYAKKTGITITNTDFPEEQQAAGNHTLTIDIESPVTYERLIRFLEAIEGNLPKMQLSGINVNRASGNGVTVESISIQVATR